jgi:hypothetical protein
MNAARLEGTDIVTGQKTTMRDNRLRNSRMQASNLRLRDQDRSAAPRGISDALNQD